MWFSKKKQEELPIDRLLKVEKRLNKLEAENLELFVALETIRNKVLKKIRIHQEEEKDETTKDLYNSVLLRE